LLAAYQLRFSSAGSSCSVLHLGGLAAVLCGFGVVLEGELLLACGVFGLVSRRFFLWCAFSL